jgi:trehalose 6-phosphate phosphatase
VALEPMRAALSRHAPLLRAAAIRIEDKGQSIALHYRTAPDHAAARACIDPLLEASPGVRALHGHCVCNLVAPGAPGKAEAVRELMRRAGAEALFYAGDDADDERVFGVARPGWLTVRVGGAGQATRAAYRVEGSGQVGVALGLALRSRSS